MSAMDAATIRIALQADASNMISGFAAGQASAGRFERATTGALNRVKTAYAGLSASQKILAGATVAGGALALAMGAVVGPAIQFESAFAGVRKTVDGTPGQLQGIRDGLLDMSQVMPTSAQELAAIAENAGQLGVAAPDVLRFTETIAMLGETTDLDFEEAAQSLARFLNVTGDGAGAIGQTADVIVELGNNSATTESQIVNFSTRLASAFTVAGATSDEILAVAAAFSSMGIRAEAGGSALSKIITSISDAAIDGGADLQTYAETAGLLPEEFAEIAKASPVEALLLFGEGLARVQAEGDSITPTLEALKLGGLRTSEIFRLLALNSDDVRVSLGLAAGQMDEGGAAAEEYGKRIETTASRLEILRNRLNTLAIEAGTPILDVVALSADKAGDAILALGEILRPLASELGGTFSNAADAAGAFYDVLGRPALLVAAASITGLATTATSLLGVFNSLGSAGTVAAAAVLAIGLNAGTVASIVARLALSVSLAGSSFTAMAIGARAASLAVAASPYVAVGLALAAVGLALAAVGKAYFDAGNAARDAGDRFRTAATNAFDSGTYNEVVTSLGNITARYDELAESSARVESGADGWTRFGRAVGGVVDVMNPFTENTLANTTAEMDELNRIIADLGLGNYEESIRLAAQATGLQEQEVVDLARELGVLEGLTKGTVGQFYEAVDVLRLSATATQELSDRTGVAADKILDGTATLDDYAAGLGLAASQVEFLADKLENVDVEDLLDSETAGEAFDAIEALKNSYAGLADQIGITVETYISQLQAVERVSDAQGRLSEEISATTSAMESARQAQTLAADASVEFAAALDAVGQSGEGLDGLGPAFESYQLAIAATSTTLDEFKGQQAEAALAIAEAGAAAGLSGPQIAQLIQAYTVPDAQILQIQGLGAELQGASAEFTALQAQALKGILVELGVIDEASPVLSAVLESLRLFATDEGESYTAALAAADAGSLGLIADSSLEAETFEDEYEAELSVEAQAAIDNLNAVREQLRDFTESEYIAFLLANGVAAEEAIRLTANYADTAWVTEFPAILTADGSGAIEVIELTRGTASDYAAADYGSLLTSSGAPAIAEMEFTRAELQAMSAAEYLSTLTTTGAPARAETAFTAQELRNMSAAEYLSTLTSNGRPARGEADTTASHLRMQAAQRYESTLTANGRGAINVANEVNRAIRGIPTVWSTSIITYYRTVGSSSSRSSLGGGAPVAGPRADGGIDYGRTSYMADGALMGTPERRGPAQIYGPRMPWRVFFGEPETEGEAYIPLAASKRARSLDIWHETGRLLGAMADGGIAGARPGATGPVGSSNFFQMVANVHVDAAGVAGLNAEDVGRIAGERVEQALQSAAGDIANHRIVI